jgi:CheY-like chemotaxis protein
MPEDLMISRVNEVFEKYIQIEGIEGRMMSEVLGKESKHLMQVCQEVARDFEKTSPRIVDDFLYCNGVSLSAMVMMAGYNEFVCFATPTSSLLYSMVHNLSSGLHDTRLSKELQHKIRTYLNTIVGFSELMKDEEDTNVKEEYINIINENAEELINVTNIKEDSDMESQKTFVSQDGTEKEQEKPTILVAEDTESNYMLVSYILKNQYNLVWAHDGIEALELYEKTKPDLILMDVRMPRLGGLSATSKIRETDKTTPIIALTAFAFESDKSKTLEAGCTDFLSKPINVSVLKSTVGKYLKK